METIILRAVDVWKTYTNPPKWVLRGINLEVLRGARVGIVGSNGTGKTTLLRILAGLTIPTRGKVTILESPLSRPESRRMLGVVLHNSLLYEELSVRENLEYYATLFGVESYDPEGDIVVDNLGLGRYLDVKVRELSFGWRRRADIARALLHRPQLLLVDEPFTGLDEQGVNSLSALLRDLSKRGLSIIATSPRMGDLDRLELDEVYRLEGGRINAV